MIEGKQSVLDWFNSHDANYWTIFNSDKSDSGNFFAKYSNEQEDAGKSDAYNELSRALSFLSRGKFKIVCTLSPKMAARGKQETMFEITTTANNMPAPIPTLGGIPDGYISKSEIGSIVSDELNKYKTEVRLKEMEAQIKELEKQNKDLEDAATEPMTVIMGHLQPYLGAIISSIMPGVQKMVAGIPPGDSNDIHQHQFKTQPLHMAQHNNETETAELSPEQLQRLTAVVEKLQSVTPDWLENLELIANKVVAKPALLNMLNML